MSCSVNLVPAARLEALARARRRTTWLGVGAVLIVLITAAWSVQQVAERAVNRLATEVGLLQGQRTEVQRQLMAATARRTKLLEDLETVAAARHTQPWARRLLRLTRAAPEDVFLTAVEIATSEAPRMTLSGAPRATPPGAPERPPAASRVENVGHNGPLAGQLVHLRGYAVSHDALLELLHALQSLPDWSHVELVRAKSEPYRGGSAVAFELECRMEEDQR